MQSPELNSKPKEDTYFSLNNQLNIVKDGRIQLHKDQEAAKAYFLENVNLKTRFFYTLDEKLNYLIENDYIKEDFLLKYDRDFIKKLFKRVYKKKFRFRSFMGAYKFYEQYAMRSDDGQYILERYEDRIAFNALAMGDGNEERALDTAEELITQRYQPATPTFLNIGKKRAGEMVSCFLLDIADDMNSIGRVINSALQLSKIGGGIGLNMTNLRAKNDPIKGVAGLADGVVKVMKIFEDALSYANQGGKRDGAGAVYLNVFHPDIIDFLSVRKENADEKIRIKTLSLGLIVPDKFYELVSKNQDMYLFSPHDAAKEYGVEFGSIDITKEYDNMVDNPRINKTKISARALEEEISNLQNESGYPYILNIDTANEANTGGGIIKMSNLCSEILQDQESSILNDDQTYKHIGTDVSCNLASLNAKNLLDSPDIGKSIRTAHRGVHWVSINSNITTVPSVARGNEETNATGMGMMNLHGLFAFNHIHYGSKESLELTEALFMLVNYWTLYESNQIAIENGKPYVGFEKSTYADGSYFSKYLSKIEGYNKYAHDTGEFSFAFDKVKDIVGYQNMPTLGDWHYLEESVKKHGIANKYRMAIAPTGSISYINEATASIHPIVSRIEERVEGKRGKVYYSAPYLSDETIPYYKSAYDMDQRLIIDVYAVATKHIDQGASMTLFMLEDVPEGMYEWKIGSENPTKKTTRDLSILRLYAWSKGIKTIYYIRTFTADGETVGANECESCSI